MTETNQDIVRLAAERLKKHEEVCLVSGFNCSGSPYYSKSHGIDNDAVIRDVYTLKNAYLAEHHSAMNSESWQSQVSVIKWYSPEVAKTWPDGSHVLVQRPSGVIDSTLLRVDWIDRFYSFCRLALLDATG